MNMLKMEEMKKKTEKMELERKLEAEKRELELEMEKVKREHEAVKSETEKAKIQEKMLAMDMKKQKMIYDQQIREEEKLMEEKMKEMELLRTENRELRKSFSIGGSGSSSLGLRNELRNSSLQLPEAKVTGAQSSRYMIRNFVDTFMLFNLPNFAMATLLVNRNFILNISANL